MRTKIFFYSMDGNTKYAAETIAKTMEGDVAELKPVKPFPSKGFRKIFIGGMKAIFKNTPQLESYDSNTDYDLIIIGTPVWAGSVTPPVRTFLKTNDLSGKNIALVACHQGGGAARCFSQIKKLQPGCNIISTLDLIEPTKNDNINEAADWAKSLRV